MNEDYDFDPKQLNPNAATFYGLIQVLKNIKEGQNIVIQFLNGGEVRGKKVYFDEETLMLGIHVNFFFNKKSDLSPNPVQEEFNLYFRYRIDSIIGIGTEAQVAK